MRAAGLPEAFVETIETGWWTTVDQMHGAAHAAAAIGAGIDLMQGVQMHNSLKRRGAI